MAGIKIVGLAKVEKKLKRNTTLDDLKRVVRKNGSEMQQKAQENAPVDTGTLKRSIGLGIADVGLTAEVEPTAEYAPYVELGTRFMEAQPYLKPAFDAQSIKFKNDVQKLVR